MPIVMNNTINQIRLLAAGADDRATKAKRLAERIRTLGGYRWVGVYDVGSELVKIIGWDGPGPPEHSAFPVTEGLTGAAIRDKKAIICGDVGNDSRYLTAFSGTKSQMIVPVLDPGSGCVIGTVDIESELPNAFADSDRQMAQQCAEAALPMWLLR